MRAVMVAGKIRHLAGWKKEPGDHRDFKLVPPGQLLPQTVNLLAYFPPVNDQGQLGSCVANGSCEAFEFLEAGGNHLQARTLYSRLYVYYYGRQSEGIPPAEDSGMFIRDGVKTIATRGVCLETTWPYSDDSRFSLQPPAAADAEAAAHKATMYYRCAGPDGKASLQAMKASIAQGFPVVFGFNVPNNFMSQECADTGILHYPAPNEGYDGGHCVVAGGYDDTIVIDGVAGAFLCRNSWGTGWGCNAQGGTTGERGNFYMPYRFITDSIADDPWTIRRGDA
jgi:C1A family cysteine protease